MNIPFYSKLLASTLLVLLTGCFNGESDESESTGGIQNITVTSLSAQNNTYNEGETVYFSLNTQGDRSNSISYDWDVKFDGQDLAFNGQGTQSISFTAPEVESIRTVSVSVKLNMPDGHLLGKNSYFTSVFIYDLDPVKASSYGIIENGLSTTLTKVNELNLALIPTGTTWRLNTYINSPTLEQFGFEGERYNATQQIVYTETDIFSHEGFRRCGSSTIESFIPFQARLHCNGTLETNLYQSDSAFRIEESCDGKVGYAQNFTQVANNQTTSFGEVSLTLTGYDGFATVSNLCGAVSEVVAISYEDNNNDGSPDNIAGGSTYAELHGEYQGAPIKIAINIDDVKTYWHYDLEDFFDPENYNDIKFSSTALTKIDGLSAEDGDLSVKRTKSTIEVEVDATYQDSEGTTVDVDGTFSLSFE